MLSPCSRVDYCRLIYCYRCHGRWHEWGHFCSAWESWPCYVGGSSCGSDGDHSSWRPGVPKVPENVAPPGEVVCPQIKGYNESLYFRCFKCHPKRTIQADMRRAFAAVTYQEDRPITCLWFDHPIWACCCTALKSSMSNLQHIVISDHLVCFYKGFRAGANLKK